MRITAFRTLIFAAVASVAAPVLSLEGIPVVPASVMKSSGQHTAHTAPASKPEYQVEAPSSASSAPTELEMTPGVNQILTIALNHVNRIVTPFSNPEVTSTTLSMGSDGVCGEVCIKDNVVYLATDQGAPTSLFITEKGSQALALSLTLVPREIPPREIFLKLGHEAVAAQHVANRRAQRWEESQPYVDTIRGVFRELALGNTPQGYTMNKTPSSIRPPRCDHPGLEVNFSNGQLFQGHHLTVFVGVATNGGDRPVEFKEATCGDWDVAGVAVWPRNVLHPGEKTEVFVARKQAQITAPAARRSSLLGGE